MEYFVRKKGNCFLGRYLLGLLDNGEIFVWHKDKDVVKFVAGFDRQEESFSTGSTLWHTMKYKVGDICPAPLFFYTFALWGI